MAQNAKFERGTADGYLYKMADDDDDDDDDNDDTTSHHVDHGADAERWTLVGKGHVQILGKEMDIANEMRQDSERRLNEVQALADEVLRLAHQHKNRLVPTAALQRLQGQLNFVTDTCKCVRAFLHGITASIKSQGRVWSKKGNKRTRAVMMGIAAGAAPSVGGGSWSWDEWNIGPSVALALTCDHEIVELLRSCHQHNGAAWVARRSPPDYNNTVWIFNDSAGLSATTGADKRAAACWAWSPRWTAKGGPGCPFICEDWCAAALGRLNSTQEEAANGEANLQWILRTCPWAECVLEVSAPPPHVPHDPLQHSYSHQKENLADTYSAVKRG